MYKILDKYKKYFDQCAYFIIEKQMCFDKIRNLMAIKLGQHCQSYFILKYPEKIKNIIEFPAYHKTILLGAKKIKGNKILKNGKHNWKTMDKKSRKKWAILKAIEILKLRNEEISITEFKKKDDLADTLLQMQAFKILNFFKKKKIFLNK